MQRIHDVIIVGAGPATIGSLLALSEDADVAIVTGERDISANGNFRDGAKLHPKIGSVHRKTQTAPGAVNGQSFAAVSSCLFETAIIGGLANYWGQSLARYASGDPWPRDVFSSHAEYLNACGQIESLFVRSPAEDTGDLFGDGGYDVRTPRLVVGVPGMPECGLLAMRQAFIDLCARRRCAVFPTAVLGWDDHGDHMCVHLADRTILKGRRLVLAAGVVGSLRLAMASCPEISAVSLKDHAPYMLQVAGLNRHLPLAREDALFHFNSLTVERIADQRVRLFSSVYRISRAPLDLLLAAAGLPALFPNSRLPAVADWLVPVQIWTERSYMRYRMTRGYVQAESLEMPDPDRDEELQQFTKWLETKGRPIKRGMTKPGEGFHYHAGEVSLARGIDLPLQSFLDSRYGGRLTCVDGSRLSVIGCRPHTLTAMATAYMSTLRTMESADMTPI